MTEIDRMQDPIERAFDGDPWSGPSPMSDFDGLEVSGEAHAVLKSNSA